MSVLNDLISGRANAAGAAPRPRRSPATIHDNRSLSTIRRSRADAMTARPYTVLEPARSANNCGSIASVRAKRDAAARLALPFATGIVAALPIRKRSGSGSLPLPPVTTLCP